MVYITSHDKAKIHYQLLGQGDPCLVFVHGWGSHSGIWKRQQEYFSRYSRVITMDLRGHGLSPWQSEEIPGDVFDILLRDFMALKENLELEHVIWIGWSLGGILGMLLASQQWPWLKGLVVVGGTPKFVSSVDFSPGLSQETVQRIKKHFKKNPMKTLKSCTASYFSRNEKNHGMDDAEIILPDVRGALSVFDRLCEIDLRPVLKKNKIPTLICHGTDDAVCPPEAGVYLKNNVETSRLEFFEGHGHIPFFTDSHRFNRIVERFCQILSSRYQFEKEVSHIVREE